MSPMKVLLFNGSPKKNGCTATALGGIAKILNEQNIDTEIVEIGSRAVRGCIACGGCVKTGSCVFAKEDGLDEIYKKCEEADGFVFGSPVYFSSANGTMVSFLDRLFFSGGKYLAHKPGAVICSARRGGTTATLDQLNKYVTYNQMPLVSSRYWSMVHGNKPEEVLQDKEGVQIMETIGKNMAWLLKSIEAGKAAGVPQPEAEQKVFTNFIR